MVKYKHTITLSDGSGPPWFPLPTAKHFLGNSKLGMLFRVMEQRATTEGKSLSNEFEGNKDSNWLNKYVHTPTHPHPYTHKHTTKAEL